MVNQLTSWPVSQLNRQMVRQAHHHSKHPERSRGTGKCRLWRHPANRRWPANGSTGSPSLETSRAKSRDRQTDKQLFTEAKKYIPGGVNSPIRSFKAVGGYPVFIKEAKGAKIFSEDGQEFIDYCLSFGALILGHSHSAVVRAIKEAASKGNSFGTPTKLETELVKMIVEAMPSIEKLRLTNSGTEAVMGAIRLARAFTRKDKIIKFAGSYHGHADYLLDCPGVPLDFKKNTIVLPYNNVKELKKTIKRYQKKIAGVIVEPVAGNMGVVLPQPEFLQVLREVTNKFKVVLIFDEVITGFRVSYGGAQVFFNVKPDLTCLGKIIGGGLACGAFGGRNEIMKLLAPEGKVYQAGTFCGNPVVVSIGIATLSILKQNNPYGILNRRTKKFCEEIKLIAQGKLKIKLNYIGSMFSIFFAKENIIDFQTAKMQNTNLFKKFFHSLLKKGVYLAPSGFEANFLSSAHTPQDLEKTLKVIKETFTNLKGS